MTNKYLQSLFFLFFTFLLGIPSAAASVDQEINSLKIISEWKIDSRTEPYGANIAISPDGLWLAYFGNMPHCILYIKNLSSNEEKTILTEEKAPAHWIWASDLAFSPDGKRLIFEAGTGPRYSNVVYNTALNDSDIIELASDGPEELQDSSDKTGKNFYTLSVSHPTFSPDGNKIFVWQNIERGPLDETNGRVKDIHHEEYVALLSPTDIQQGPQQLVKGIPRFWSIDGTGIYYTRLNAKRTKLNTYRFDLAKKTSSMLPIQWPSGFIGRVPGQNAVFIRDVPQNKVVKILNMDGTPPSPELSKIAELIPAKDSEGRFLDQIVFGGKSDQFLLTYKLYTLSSSIPSEHIEFVRIH